MKIQKGDIIFVDNGKPAVVTGRDASDRIIAKTKGSEFEKSRRLGVINGLTETDRSAFETIMSRLKNQQDPLAQLKELDQTIEELDKDPKNIQLVKYLGGEKAHLIHSKGVHPQEYKIDEYELY